MDTHSQVGAQDRSKQQSLQGALHELVHIELAGHGGGLPQRPRGRIEARSLLFFVQRLTLPYL